MALPVAQQLHLICVLQVAEASLLTCKVDGLLVVEDVGSDTISQWNSTQATEATAEALDQRDFQFFPSMALPASISPIR